MNGEDGIRHHIEGEMSLNISRLLSIILEKNYRRVENKIKQNPFNFELATLLLPLNKQKIHSAIVSENILKMH